MSRRATSSKFPHKGQEFSVDDDVDEVQAATEQQLKEIKEQKRQGQTLRRKPSNVRRPTGAARGPTLTTIESTEDDAAEEEHAGAPTDAEAQPGSSEEETVRADEDDSGTGENDDEADLSDAESFTLKDRQDAINVTHPFGIRIWKPALYKKGRSVQRNAEADIHSNPGLFVSRWLLLFNIAWTLVFGWWLAIVAAAGALLCALLAFDESCKAYSRLLYHLAVYIFYPFGKYVKLLQDDQ
jgi:Ca2+:H+ antiporter